MSKPAWDEAATAASNAHRLLPWLANQYFEQGRKLLSKKHSAAGLHRFRLKTKRLRYTLELFREVYGPSFERWLDLLRPLQTALGDINDCAATLKLIDTRLHRDRKKLRSFLEKRSAKKTAEFEEYWRTTFDAPGQHKAWVDYLSKARAAVPLNRPRSTGRLGIDR